MPSKTAAASLRPPGEGASTSPITPSPRCTDPPNSQKPSTLPSRSPTSSLQCPRDSTQRLSSALVPGSDSARGSRQDWEHSLGRDHFSPPGKTGTGNRGRDEGSLEQGQSKTSPRKGQRGPAPLPGHLSLTHLGLGQADLPLQILRDHFPSGKEN